MPAASLPLHKSLQQINGQRENDGGVLLCCDGVEALQVPQLESRGWLSNDQRCFFQSPGGLHLSLCSYDLKHRQTLFLIITHSLSRREIIVLPHLCSGLPTGLCLCCHGSLQLLRQLHILDLHTLHPNTPRISGFIQGFLRGTIL